MTDAQRNCLRWLNEHPGATVFSYYESRGLSSSGMERVSRRGAAGRMETRLIDGGYLAAGRRRGESQVTTKGQEELARGLAR